MSPDLSRLSPPSVSDVKVAAVAEIRYLLHLYLTLNGALAVEKMGLISPSFRRLHCRVLPTREATSSPFSQ